MIKKTLQYIIVAAVILSFAGANLAYAQQGESVVSNFIKNVSMWFNGTGGSQSQEPIPVFESTPTEPVEEWAGTDWINPSAVVTSEETKSLTDYLFAIKAHKPIVCEGENKLLQWNGSVWSCIYLEPNDAACLVGNELVENGGGTLRYEQASVPFGESCTAEIRLCEDGALSGSFGFTECTVAEANSCIFDGTEVPNNEVVTAYQSSTVSNGSSCVSEQRVCSNGTLTGSFEHDSCEVLPQVQSCVGSWVVESGSCTVGYHNACPVNQGELLLQGSQTERYVITVPAANGGETCPFSDGETRFTPCYAYECFSFVAGTQVATPDGNVAIETIIVGDQVLGQEGINTVVELKPHFNTDLVYGFNDTDYFVTGGHPFMTTEGWKAFEEIAARAINPDLEINRLEIGDVLIRENGEQEVIKEIRSQQMGVPVYNFEVTGDRTYFADGYVVHNK